MSMRLLDKHKCGVSGENVHVPFFMREKASMSLVSQKEEFIPNRCRKRPVILKLGFYWVCVQVKPSAGF